MENEQIIYTDVNQINKPNIAAIGNIQGNDYIELKQKVEQAKKEGLNENIINLRNNYTLISPEREKAKDNKIEYIKHHLNQVNDMLDKQNLSTYTDPTTGAQIANATPERIWVSQNVGFIFSTGAVFDKHDKQFLDEIYSFFDVHSDQYLGCYHFVYSYETDLIKKFENLQTITNGNYHICVFVIVYADKDVLKHAPEKLFSYSGIVETLVEHDDIRDELIRLMIKYGFTKTTQIKQSTVSHIGKNDKQVLPDINLQYDTEVDYNKTSRELFSNLKQHDKIIGTRTRINGSVSPLRSHPRKMRMKQTNPRGDDLENRIEFDSFVSYTKPNDILGIAPRINNNLQTMANNTVENEQQQVYQIYDKDDKTTIPSFNIHNNV